MADSRLTDLTETSVPALDDWLYSVDLSDTTDNAAGSSRKLSFNRALGLLNHVVQGRLTLESGVPVSTSDQTAKTSVYFTPYNGNLISLYDGTRWKLYQFTELTLALGTLTSGKNYDVFCYDNAGTLTLELSAAWTDDTTRADALTTQNGVYVKSGAATRRYLGTFRTTSTTTTELSFGGASQVGGKLFLWNMYNRVLAEALVIDTTNTWSYTSATIRQANGASGNKVEFVCGMSDVHLHAHLMGSGYTVGTTSNAGSVGIGIDSITAYSARCLSGEFYNGGASIVAHQSTAAYGGKPGLGYHYLSWLEKGVSTATQCVFYGDDGGSGQSGLKVFMEI